MTLCLKIPFHFEKEKGLWADRSVQRGWLLSGALEGTFRPGPAGSGGCLPLGLGRGVDAIRTAQLL